MWATASAMGPGVLPVGTTVVSEHTTTLDLALDVRLLGRQFERRIDRKHHQVSTLMAQEGGFDVRWSANRHQAFEPGHSHDRVLPVVGRSYSVRGGEVQGELSTVERDIVRQVALPDQLTGIRGMLGPSLVVGEERPAGELFAGILAEAPGEPRLIDGTLVLRELTEHTALYRLDVVLESIGTDAKGTHIVTRLEGGGDLQVQVQTGWTERLDLVGTVTVRATRPDLETSGRGTFRTTTSLDYR